MEPTRRDFLRNALLVLTFGSIGACNVIITSAIAKSEIVLVGSTPGGVEIKTMLGINTAKPVDFIRWRIALNDNQIYYLQVGFGIGKPNTHDFENGGESVTRKGRYTVSKSNGVSIITLESAKQSESITIAKLNDDVFHIVSANGRLLSGNGGGWSYSLSREGESRVRLTGLPQWPKSLDEKTTGTSVFSGRTPCAEIAQEYKIPVGDDCLRLKWKLTLNRDPKTNKPTTFVMQGSLRRSEPVEGRWHIVRGTPSNPEAVIYRLEAARPENSMSLLLLDQNVLYFLDNENRLIKGNGDFGYALDRRNEVGMK